MNVLSGHPILIKYVGLLNKLKHYLPASILKTLYCSLILPHLNYGSLAWGFDAKRIFKLQKRALRCITNSKFNAHTVPLFKQLNLLKIDDIFFIELHEVLLQVLSLFIAFLLIEIFLLMLIYTVTILEQYLSWLWLSCPGNSVC